MLGFGPQELIIILIIVLVLFGGKKLPEVAKSIGKGVREFKNETNKIDSEPESSSELPGEENS